MCIYCTYEKKHKELNHNLINLNDYFLTENDLKKYKNYLKNYENRFKEIENEYKNNLIFLESLKLELEEKFYI